MSIYSLIEKNDIESIYKIIEDIISSPNKLNYLTRFYAKSFKLYFLIKENKLDEAKKIYDEFSENEMKEFKKPETLFGFTVLLLYLVNVEKSDSLVNDIEKSFYKLYKVDDTLTKEENKILFEKELKLIKKSAD